MENNIEINKIYKENCFTFIDNLPNDFVDMIITSPPYWGLRDYEIENQLGQEDSPLDYINSLMFLFNKLQRVLKSSGTCWVNIGDTYSSGKEIPRKSLCQIPNRFAISMVDAGWILRNEIIWHKPNAMPSSAKDRFTNDFEKLFFFTKNTKYFFEIQREPHKEISLKRIKTPWNGNLTKGHSLGGLKNGDMSKMCHPDGRNKRTVWSISTKSFKGAHFAVYPPDLIETPIKSGCPENGLVLDPFMGAGTTALVAKRLNRNFIGCELNSEYIKIAEDRLKNEL